VIAVDGVVNIPVEVASSLSFRRNLFSSLYKQR